MELAVIIFLCLLFPAGALYSYIRAKKQQEAGKKVLEAAFSQHGNRIVVDRHFLLTTNKKWCRVRTVFKWQEPVGHFDDKLHRYRLSIETGSGQELYAEERSMTEFFGSCWYQSSKLKRRSDASCICDAVLVEFLPPWPGQYALKLDLQAVEGASELLNFTVMISEGVVPLKRRPYVHACVDLRKNAPHKESENEESDFPIDSFC
ncbi:MAG: hypothetical protein JW832_17165 [Deltaproteobacteria bacterium]|nr:hypothetical protein [Deltaproteobacteria bacterium]